jgi:hypothetical protein
VAKSVSEQGAINYKTLNELAQLLDAIYSHQCVSYLVHRLTIKVKQMLNHSIIEWVGSTKLIEIKDIKLIENTRSKHLTTRCGKDRARYLEATIN